MDPMGYIKCRHGGWDPHFDVWFLMVGPWQVEADQPSPTTPGAFSLIASGIDLESTEVGMKQKCTKLVELGRFIYIYICWVWPPHCNSGK